MKLDEIADRNQAAPDLAAHGSLDLRVIQVEARGDFAGLGGGQRGFAFADDFAAAIVFLFGNRLGAAQAVGALEVVPRQFQTGLGFLAAGLRLVQLGLVGSRINHEQQLAGFDLRPVLKVDRVNVARHPGPDFDHLDRLQMPGVFVPVGDRGKLGRLDGNLRGRRRRGLGRSAGRQQSGADDWKQTQPESLSGKMLAAREPGGKDPHGWVGARRTKGGYGVHRQRVLHLGIN